MKQYILFFFVFVIISAFSLQAQVQLSENARISIITISPWGGAVYAMYGHTAVRVQDSAWGMDKVFNYGYFSSQQPNFIFNFARGRANYSVEIRDINSFLRSYAWNGLEAIEQVLDLTQEEKQNLFSAMHISALPENRDYLYNFLFDNCVTRPRDMLETYVLGMIFPEDARIQTFRNLIHECVNPFPWVQFGIDLVIGSGADSIITLRDKMFIPRYFKEALAETVVVRNGIATPLVKETNTLLEAVVDDGERRRMLFTPMLVMLLLLFIAILVSWMQWKKTSPLFKLFDTFLFLVVGLGGVVVFFLMFFSIHPATNPNWNLVWMNPLAFVFAILFWVKPLQKTVYYYHFATFTVLALFLLLLWLIPQQLNPAFFPLIVSLLLRSGMNGFCREVSGGSDDKF